jgi:MFS superfamily sulfate permease-like transporter
MTTLALTVIAQNSQSAPSDGVGAGLIVGTIVGVIVAIALIWLVVTRMTKRSRGGVEPVEDERRRGNPPVEGIERGG